MHPVMPLVVRCAADARAASAWRCDTRWVVEPASALHRRSSMAAKMTACALLTAAILAGCSSQSSKPDASPALGPGPAPSVVGLVGAKAVDRLRSAGYETIAVRGRWSDKRVGTVLAQHSS